MEYLCTDVDVCRKAPNGDKDERSGVEMQHVGASRPRRTRV